MLGIVHDRLPADHAEFGLRRSFAQFVRRAARVNAHIVNAHLLNAQRDVTEIKK
jgi:hypothetical protein